MTRAVFCVTTDYASPFRPCLIRGEHLGNCDGFERRFDVETGQTEHTYTLDIDPDTGENRRLWIECPGCAPKPAQDGRLCATHVRKIDAVFDRDARGNLVTVDLVTHLWSIFDSGAPAGGERVSGGETGSRWTLSESRIAAGEILDAFGIRWETTDDVKTVADHVFDALGGSWEQKTAADASRSVLVVNAVERALRRFPLVESSRPVPAVRCPKCGRLALIWHPPLTQRDDVDVRCERCGEQQSHEWLEATLTILGRNRP